MAAHPIRDKAISVSRAQRVSNMAVRYPDLPSLQGVHSYPRHDSYDEVWRSVKNPRGPVFLSSVTTCLHELHEIHDHRYLSSCCRVEASSPDTTTTGRAEWGHDYVATASSSHWPFRCGNYPWHQKRMCLPINDELTTNVIAKIESVLRNCAIFVWVVCKWSVNNWLMHSWFLMLKLLLDQSKRNLSPQ